MSKKSAGILLFRFQDKQLQVLLVHPGGPFWSKKDLGSWSVPKGELDENEDILYAAIREMEEETGFKACGPFISLQPVKQKSGKIIYIFATQNEFDPRNLKSNNCVIEWPPHTGKRLEIPEVDRAEWLYLNEAKGKIVKGQLPLLFELEQKLGNNPTIKENKYS
ncbi:MAG: NUDIX domain-containing protein [Ginsengibacter sp.]